MFASFVRVLLYLVFTRTGLSANRQVAVYYPDRDSTLEHRVIPLGFREDKIYLRDQYKIYELNASNLDIVRSARVCFSPCSPNSIVLINDIESVITVCESAENRVCSLWSTSDFKPLGNSSVTVTVSQLLTRPAIGIVTKDGSSYVAVTYGPGIKPDRYGGNRSFHETYKFVISRIRSSESPLNRDKTLPFRLPNNVGLGDFLIFFKGAIELEEHVFFITNQKFKAVKNQKYTSKLISVCKNDPYFYTYTDIVLECRNKDNIFNLIQDIQVFTPSEKLREELNLDATETDVILAGIFATGDDPDRPENSSAVCLYSMKDVRRKISEAREKFVVCPGSNLTENERYMDNNIPGGCLNETVNVTVAARLSGECEETIPLYSYVIGEVVLSADTMFVSPSSNGRLTKVFVKNVEDVRTRKQVVMIFAGTSTGKVLTIRIISATSGHLIDEITVDAEHQIKALRVDKEENIYAMSDRKLVKFEPFKCARYKSCENVTTSLNALCGWCVYQSRSVPTSGSHCHHAQEPNHFIPAGGNCSSLLLTSDYFEVGKVTQIFFQVSNFPNPLAGDEFYCEFNMNHGKHVYFDVAKIGENASFTCYTPNITRHSKAVLKLLVATNSVLHRRRHNVSLAQTPIHLYDCQVFQRCRECTENSKRQCIWHMENGCYRHSLTNESSSGALKFLKPSSCPITKRLAPETPFIHAKITTTVFIEVGNVDESIDLKCCVQGCPCSAAKYANRTMIYCPVLVGNSGTAIQTLPLQIQYAGRNLDTTEAITVTVYECRHLVTDCSQCSSLNSIKFNCTWCHPGTCSFRGTGDCQPLQPCPPPVLTKITPASSPLGGGTLVTISGHDIGTSPGSISTIQLAGIPCSLIEDAYVVSLAVVCRTGDADKRANRTDFPGKVQITIGNVTSSGLKFIYKDPVINRIFPTSGPQIGGTVVTLSGRNLEIGNRNVTACFMTDDKRKICKKASVIRSDTSTSEEHHIETDTPPSGSATEVVAVEVIFDSDTPRQIKSTYRYLPDPVIEAIHPMRSIMSGGIEITVLGRRLQNARSAGIYATYKNQTRFRRCDFKSDKQVECPTPSLGQPDINLTWKTEVAAVVHLDGVQKAFDLDYYIDPEIGTTDFVNNSTLLDVTHGHILIEGRHLTLAATLSDVKVTVGQASCHIDTFNATFIKCMVPKRLSELELRNEKLLPVKVRIGDLNKVVGYIHQDKMISTKAGPSFITVVILSSLSGFLGIIVLSVVLWRLEICVRKNKTRLPYLSMTRLSGQDNTPILPSRERRHSNQNTYEVINDLVPENSTHTDQTNRLLKTNDDETHYQTLDDDISSKTQRSASPDETVRSADLNINDDNNYSTRKEYYLSPIMLNELKDRIGSKDKPDSSTGEVRNDGK